MWRQACWLHLHPPVSAIQIYPPASVSFFWGVGGPMKNKGMGGVFQHQGAGQPVFIIILVFEPAGP